MYVKKRKDGRWEGRLVDHNHLDKNLKPKTKYFYGKTRKEVMTKISDYQVKQDFCRDKQTVASYYESWKDTYCSALSESTIHGYEVIYRNHIEPTFGDMDIASIRQAHVQDWVNKMKDSSRKSVSNRLGLLSKMMTDALNNDVINKNPCTGVRKPTTEPYQYYIYNMTEFVQLLEAAEGTKFYLPVVLAGMVGLRRSEIFALDWSDIDFKERTVTINKAYVPVGSSFTLKTPKSVSGWRIVPIPDAALQILSEYRGIGLIINRVGLSNWSYDFKQFLISNGLPPTRFHDLRHFNATQMLEAGIPDKVASKRLGHSEINMTKKYQHVLDAMENRAVNMLDNQFVDIKKGQNKGQAPSNTSRIAD